MESVNTASGSAVRWPKTPQTHWSTRGFRGGCRNETFLRSTLGTYRGPAKRAHVGRRTTQRGRERGPRSR
eukprot:4424075-Lingulodinium_polyedra.AAC.1